MKITDQLHKMGFDDSQIADARPVDGKPLLATGRLAEKTEGMNKTEASYAALLDWEVSQGMVAAYWYESVKLRLATRTWYTPDFLVLYSNGGFQFVEIKGFLRDDAAVKYKLAREQYSWAEWVMLRRVKGQWVKVNI